MSREGYTLGWESEVVCHSQREGLRARSREAAGPVADQADPATRARRRRAAAVLAVPRHAVPARAKRDVPPGAGAHVGVAQDERPLRVEPVPEAAPCPTGAVAHGAPP